MREGTQATGTGGEVLLVGGIANRGQVVRIGDTVRRPRRDTTPATHALLHHLGAPHSSLHPPH